MKRSFTSKIESFNKDVAERMDEVCRECAQFLLLDVQSYWPVDSGWSRASWMISLDPDEDRVYEPRPRRGSRMPAPYQNMPDIRWGDRVFLSNSVPYVGHAENHGIAVGILDRHTEMERNIKTSVQRTQREVLRIGARLCK